MSGDFILRHKVHRDFTVLPNHILRDRRLKWSPTARSQNRIFPMWSKQAWPTYPGLANRPLTSTSTQQERSETTTTAPAHAPVVVVGLDDGLLAAHRDSILKSLTSCPESLRQQVVDEAVGIATAGRIRSNVGALIRKLALAAAAGTFEPAAGVAVASARLRAQQDRGRQAAEEAERRRMDTPEAREASRRARDVAIARFSALRRPSSVVAGTSSAGGSIEGSDR